jgi:hypothetical protein
MVNLPALWKPPETYQISEGQHPMTQRIIAIASAGGHWQQLMLLVPAYADHRVTYLTTLSGLAENYGVAPAYCIPDCNRHTKMRIIATTIVIAWHILRVRPHAVITTGAMPGLIALTLGRAIGARTVWIDSVANAEKMSASGQFARHVAHLRLSQWKSVADAEDAEFAGRLL